MKQKLLFICGLFFTLHTTAQTVHLVSNHLDDNTEGTLRKIIANAQPGDTIRFSETYFIQGINDSIILNSDISINKSLFIEGLTDIEGNPFITIRVPVTAKEAGNPRVFNKEQGGIVDIGAYEFMGATSSSISITQALFNVYPNPATEYFIVDGFEGENMLIISDINGKIILKKKVTSGETISTHALPKGMYLVRVDNMVTKLMIDN